MEHTKKEIPVFTPYFDDKEEQLFLKALRSGWVAQGPMVAQFEKMAAEYTGVGFGVATTSCTTALHLSLVALGANKHHDVIVPSYTFVATANAVEQTGATAVLVDVKLDTYCLDVDYLERFIEANYTNHSGVWKNNATCNELFCIIPVHIFGLCADMPSVNRLAKHYNMRVLEDGACALGSGINGNRTFGNVSCLSFHARKSITTGEGGMVLTDDKDIFQNLQKLRSHSASISEVKRHKNNSYLMPDYDDIGYNYRMTDIQGAIGIAQMQKIDHIIQKKRELANRYDAGLQAVPWLIPQHVPMGYYHTYQSYVVMLDYKRLGLTDIETGNSYRNRLMAYLDENGVSTRQGTHAVHLLGYYKNKYGYGSEDLPGALQCDKLSIALPLYVGLAYEDQDYVVDMLVKANRFVI